MPKFIPRGGLLSPKSYVDVPAEPRKSDFSIPIVVGYTGVMFQKPYGPSSNEAAWSPEHFDTFKKKSVEK